MEQGVDTTQSQQVGAKTRAELETNLRAATTPLPESIWDELAALKEKYYDQMGWDPVRGVPTPERLESLGIGWVTDALR